MMMFGKSTIAELETRLQIVTHALGKKRAELALKAWAPEELPYFAWNLNELAAYRKGLQEELARRHEAARTIELHGGSE